jgi:hypothetical protein
METSKFQMIFAHSVVKRKKSKENANHIRNEHRVKRDS